MTARSSITLALGLALASTSAIDALADAPAAPAHVGAPALSTAASVGHRRASSPPFRAFVDMATFMQHVLTPAATIVWRTNGFVNDASGDHDLSPQTDADWEAVVSGAATLAEATNALMIPQRTRDPAWNGYVLQLATLAEQAYQAAEKHDLKAIWDVSDRLDATCSSCHKRYGLE
jgi:hypothetical protein